MKNGKHAIEFDMIGVNGAENKDLVIVMCWSCRRVEILLQ